MKDMDESKQFDIIPITISGQGRKLHPNSVRNVQRSFTHPRLKYLFLGSFIFLVIILVGLSLSLPFFIASPDATRGQLPDGTHSIPITQDTMVSTSTPESQTTPTPEMTATIAPTASPTSTSETQKPTATSIPPTTVVSNSPQMRYSFEAGFEGWQADYTTLQTCTDQHAQGSQSLCTHLNYTSQSQRPFIYLAGSPLSTSFAGKTVSASVYVSGSSSITTKADWCIQDSHSTWNCIDVQALAKNTWLKLSYSVPDNMQPALCIGIDLYSYPVDSNITVYIDNVSW